MRTKLLAVVVGSALAAGCATDGGGPSRMSPEQLAECLQPNRRVAVEIGGLVPKPPPKPKPGEPAPKPGKPQFSPLEEKAAAQGNSAFDIGSAALKPAGAADVDQMIASIQKRKGTINSVIVSGHTDRNEARSRPASLSEDRAKAMVNYLVSKGIDQKLIFWEGKADREPVPVTKFCE